MTGQPILPEATIRIDKVCIETDLSKKSIERRVANKTFPQPIKLGARINLWRVSEVRAWLADPVGYRAAANGQEADHV